MVISYRARLFPKGMAFFYGIKLWWAARSKDIRAAGALQMQALVGPGRVEKTG